MLMMGIPNYLYRTIAQAYLLQPATLLKLLFYLSVSSYIFYDLILPWIKVPAWIIGQPGSIHR
jgi:hypothetical protein